MEKAIKILEEVKESIINAYEQKCHLSRSKIAKMMSEETWLNAKKALQLGFVDGILFAKEKMPQAEPEEEEEESTEEESSEEAPDEEDDDEDDPDKKRKAAEGHGKLQLHTCPHSGFFYAEGFCNANRYTNRPAR